MKRFFSLILCLALAVNIASCSGKKEQPKDQQQPKEQVKEQPKEQPKKRKWWETFTTDNVFKDNEA